MQQQCVSLHTDKGLKEAEQIFQKEEMEILLNTNMMYMRFADMTSEEQNSWIKLMRADLENAIDDMEIFNRRIERYNKEEQLSPEVFRKMFDSLGKSRDSFLDKAHINLIKQLIEFEDRSRKISYFANITSQDGEGFVGGIRCSCIIARKGTDVVRYLSFLKDPVVTFTGPNASKLKSTLEKQF